MTRDEYFELPPGEQEHFYECVECDEMVDKRKLDEVLFHEDHMPRPDIPYTGPGKRIG